MFRDGHRKQAVLQLCVLQFGAEVWYTIALMLSSMLLICVLSNTFQIYILSRQAEIGILLHTHRQAWEPVTDRNKGNQRFSVVWAWPRWPIICRGKPKLESSYTSIERPGNPSPIEIKVNQSFFIVRTWFRQAIICPAKPNIGYSCCSTEHCVQLCAPRSWCCCCCCCCCCC